MARRAAFLDRDGVIVESRRGGSTPPDGVDDMTVPTGVEAALRALREAGYSLVVVTNQPDVARGTATRDDVDAINAALRRALPLDAIYACFHDGPDCDCRKPRPGMLLSAARDLDLDLAGSWLVGDRWVDIAAGAAAGVRTVLLEREWSWSDTSAGAAPTDLAPDYAVGTFVEAAEVILAS